MSLDETTRKILLRPFTAQECELRDGPGGRQLTYVAQNAVIDRLNEAFGLGSWAWTVTSCIVQDGTVTVAGHLSVPGNGGHSGVSSEKMGKDPEKATKTADTDALKRAARLFGVGWHLYDKSDAVHKDMKNKGNQRSYSKRTSNGPAAATPKQLNFIEKLRVERDGSVEKLEAWAVETWGCSVASFTAEQASGCIERLLANK